MRHLIASLLLTWTCACNKPAPPVGEDAEAELVRVAQAGAAAYDRADNDLQKSALKAERAQQLRAALRGTLAFQDWAGKLSYMSTDRDGSAYVKIELAENVSIHTSRGNVISKEGSALLRPGSELYQRFSTMKVGDAVRVSGEFVPDAEFFVHETSLTERGSMSDPDFAVRIFSVLKL